MEKSSIFGWNIFVGMLLLVSLFFPACFLIDNDYGYANGEYLEDCNLGMLPECGGNLDECALFDRINCERQTHELTEWECSHPLQWDEEVAEAARQLSRDLVNLGDLEHDGWGRQNLSIASNPDEAMQGMMTGDDEPHCEGSSTLSHHCNIMHCSPTFLGVGAVKGSYAGQGDYWYYSMNFK